MDGPRVRVRRLKQRKEFLRVAGAGRKWVTPGVILQARRSVPSGPERGKDRAPPEAPGKPSERMTKSSDRSIEYGDTVGVGFTASRKVGSAVARNRAKRRLRAAVDRVIPEQALPGYELVLIARGATVDRPFADLVDDLEEALVRVGASRRKGAAGRPAGRKTRK